MELMISRNVRNYRESNSLSIKETSEKIKINYKMAQNIISCNRNNIRLEAVYNKAPTIKIDDKIKLDGTERKTSLNISIDDLLFKNIFKN